MRSSAPAGRLRSVEGEGLPGQAWASGEPVWVEDVLAEPDFPRRLAAEAGGLRAAVAFPAVGGNEVRGVLEFFVSRAARAATGGAFAASVGERHVADFVATRGALEEHRGRFQAVLDAAPARRVRKGSRTAATCSSTAVSRRSLDVRAEEIAAGRTTTSFPHDVAASARRATTSRCSITGRQIEIEEEVPHERRVAHGTCR